MHVSAASMGPSSQDLMGQARVRTMEVAMTILMIAPALPRNYVFSLRDNTLESSFKNRTTSAPGLAVVAISGTVEFGA